MKVRIGYVSNSSSSSYIVQFKRFEDPITIAGEQYTASDFFEYLNIRSNHIYNNETEVNEITYTPQDKKYLVDYIKQTIKYIDDQNTIQKLNKLIEDINKNENDILDNYARFSLSNSDKTGHFLLNLLQKYHLFIIRDQCER